MDVGGQGATTLLAQQNYRASFTSNDCFSEIHMNAKKTVYWVSLILFSVAMIFGGIADLTKNPEIMESFKKLGYPDYLASILGGWKILGVIAILIPSF